MKVADIRIDQPINIGTFFNFAKIKPDGNISAKVLDVLGNNSYLISLAGKKIKVTSKIPLEKGLIFTSKVNIENNKIFLKLLETNKENFTEVSKFNFSENSQISSSFENLLLSLGLTVDKSSIRLLQFAQELGIKLQPHKFKKARKVATSDDDNKEEKEQLSILLQEKGLLGDEGSVLSVLSSYSKNNKDTDDKSESSFPVFSEIIGDDIKSYIEEVDLASKNNKYGILTTFNMIKPLKKDEDFWIILPFEWEFKKYNGVIRVLLEPIKKSIKKIIINCGNNKKKYIFVLYFKLGEVESIEFSLHPQKDISGFISVLESMVLKEIKYVDFCTLQGFCAKDMDIYVLENSM